MEIFLSSVIAGYEDCRAAAAEAIETLGHRVVRAEDFAASPGPPQQACLAAVREADLVVLLMGASYGAVQSADLSATHEEYREARDDKPVLVFVESGWIVITRSASFSRRCRRGRRDTSGLGSLPPKS